MSDDAYKDFIDDLCKYGVLNEEDKPFVGYTNLIPLDLSEPEIKMIPLSVVSPSNSTDVLLLFLHKGLGKVLPVLTFQNCIWPLPVEPIWIK